MAGTLIGPARDIEQHIISAIEVARPYGKPKVIADHGAYLPSFEVYDDTLRACFEYLVFASHAKEMPLVVRYVITILGHPHQAVVIVALFFDNKAPSYDAIVFLCHFQHPMHRLPVGFFGAAFHIHCKSGIEHLWKDD